MGFYGSNDLTNSVKELKEDRSEELGFNPTRSQCPTFLYNKTYAHESVQYTIQHRTVLIIFSLSPPDKHHSSDVVYHRRRGKTGLKISNNTSKSTSVLVLLQGSNISNAYAWFPSSLNVVNVTSCQSSLLSIMRQTQSVLVCQFTVTAVHIDTSSLTSKHSVLQSCLSTVSVARSDVTTDTENVFSVCLRCRSRDKVECHCSQTWNSDTDLHDTGNIPSLYMWQEVDMTDIPQAHWQLGGNMGTGNCRQAFSYMFEGFSGTWYGGGASSAIERPKWFGNFFIPFCVSIFSFFPFPFCLSGFLRFRFHLP